MKRPGKTSPLGAEICSSILRHQGEFLKHGPEFLRPLTMKAVAEEIGVSPATITRFIVGKTVQTPHGRLGMRSFFPKAARTASGKALSVSTVRSMIRQIVLGENPREPVTDEKLESMLRHKGIIISRRTVARYRDFLKIPNTHVRRSGPGQRLQKRISRIEQGRKPIGNIRINMLAGG